MIDPNKLARLRELYAEHQKWIPKPIIEKIQGVDTTIHPTPSIEIAAKIMSLNYEIDDLLWELLPDIVAQGLV
jgi:hypothetical protein